MGDFTYKITVYPSKTKYCKKLGVLLNSSPRATSNDWIERVIDPKGRYVKGKWKVWVKGRFYESTRETRKGFHWDMVAQIHRIDKQAVITTEWRFTQPVDELYTAGLN